MLRPHLDLTSTNHGGGYIRSCWLSHSVCFIHSPRDNRRATSNMNDEQESNPYVSPSLPNENLAVNPKGKTHPILEATIRLIGILSFAGSLRCILTPDAMNWIAGPIVMAMYSLKGVGLVPGSLLMLLPYFTFGAFLFWVGWKLIILDRHGRIGATIACGLALASFSIGSAICCAILMLLWSPQGNHIFSDQYRKIVHET